MAPGLSSPRNANICREVKENLGFQEGSALEYQHLWARQRPEGAAEGGAAGVCMKMELESFEFPSAKLGIPGAGEHWNLSAELEMS